MYPGLASNFSAFDVCCAIRIALLTSHPLKCQDAVMAIATALMI